MRLPWTTKEPVEDHPTIQRIDAREQAEREAQFAAERAAFEEKLRERARRANAVPDDLHGFRKVTGCTCGAEAEALKNTGSSYGMSSAGIHHEDDCELTMALYVSIIEV